MVSLIEWLLFFVLWIIFFDLDSTGFKNNMALLYLLDTTCIDFLVSVVVVKGVLDCSMSLTTLKVL